MCPEESASLGRHEHLLCATPFSGLRSLQRLDPRFRREAQKKPGQAAGSRSQSPCLSGEESQAWVGSDSRANSAPLSANCRRKASTSTPLGLSFLRYRGGWYAPGDSGSSGSAADRTTPRGKGAMASLRRSLCTGRRENRRGGTSPSRQQREPAPRFAHDPRRQAGPAPSLTE